MNIFDLPMKENDAGAETIGDYFRKLAYEIWHEGESFSGKRPFGNSGWQFEIYKALLENGVVEGKLDEDGYVEELDDVAANRIVTQALKEWK